MKSRLTKVAAIAAFTVLAYPAWGLGNIFATTLMERAIQAVDNSPELRITGERGVESTWCKAALPNA
ncbi:hypothetical protein K3Z95_03675 [Pseudomonas aeruginosa]|nr:hypothetical protein [Pseudomonas aeruginosa]